MPILESLVKFRIQSYLEQIVKFHFIILIWILVSFNCQSQNTANNNLLLKQRAIFIYNLMRQTQWDNITELNEFKIGVLGNDPLIDELAEMGENRTIAGLPIVVEQYDSINAIDNLQLLYVNKKFGYSINQVYYQITNKNTLLITENYGFNESMINIINKNNTFQFELNENMLNAENFMVTPAIRQLAITSADRWEQLFQNSEKNLEEVRDKVIEQLKVLEAHEIALIKQDELLESRKNTIALQVDKINQQNTEIDLHRGNLQEVQHQYQNKVAQLNNLETQISQQKASYNNQQQAVKKLDSVLAYQDSQIALKNNLITQQKDTLSEQQSRINLQQKVTILFVIMFLLAFVSVFVIFRNYRIKKRGNNILLQLNAEKNTLISVVSHDLRTPINQIKGFANLMLLDGGEKLNTSQREYINDIIISCERQIDMIRRILDINAIESNKININSNKENLSDLSAMVVTNFQILARNKSIELTHENNSDTPMAMVDNNYLIQVLENVISNAIKYSEKEKQVVVSIDESDNKLVIAVKDQGPGISSEDLGKMFGTYQKLSAKPTDGEHSYGLGLAIAKRYIEAMHGIIYCESELGKGSTFKIEFNKAPSD